MIPVFAHHLEPHHVGIALLLFVTGAIGGWMACGRRLASRTRADA